MSSLRIYSSSPKQFKEFSNPLKKEELPKNKNIVLISPHSDDIAVGCGGAVSILSSSNNITPLLFFSGFRGVKDKNKQGSIKIRRKEMAKEAKNLQINKPLFLQLDSYNKESKSIIKQDTLKVKTYLKKINPDIIFLPHKRDLQPRHRLATYITLDVLNQIFHNRIELFFYETVWGIFDAFDFNTAFILSPQEIKRKMAAIRVHHSQLKRTAFDKAAKSLARFRALVVPEQRIGGYGEKVKNIASYLEVFYSEVKPVKP